MVVGKDGRRQKATITQKLPKPSSYLMNVDGQKVKMDLNMNNHFIPKLTEDSYNAIAKYYKEQTVAESNTVLDGITGKELLVKDQLVEIGLTNVVRGDGALKARSGDRPEFARLRNVQDMASLVMAADLNDRLIGQHLPVCLLLVATAGTGKTWLSKQLLNTLASHSYDSLGPAFLPIVIPLQSMVFYLNKLADFEDLRPESYGGDYVAWYISVSQRNEPVRDMLMDAYRSQRLIIIFDGLDEAPSLKQKIQDYVCT